MTCEVTKVTYNIYSCDTCYMSREMMEMDGLDSALVIIERDALVIIEMSK